MGLAKTAVAQQLPLESQPQTAAAESATQKQDIWLFGAEEILWICQARFADPGAPGPLLRFAYRESTARGAGLYRALPIDTIVGRIHMGAVRGRDLHVFFRDGSHRRYAASPTSPSRIALPMFTGELGLPDRALPLALAVDRTSNVLLAVVTSRDAAKVESEVAERAARLREDDAEDGVRTRSDSETPNPAEAPQELVAEAAADFAIVSYDGFAWSRSRNCPLEILRDDTVRALLVHGSRVHLVYTKSGDSGGLIHQFSSERAEPWSRPSPLTAPPGSSVLTTGWTNDAPVLVLSEPAAEGMALRILGWNQSQWEDRGALRASEAQPASFDATVEAAIHGNALALAHSGKDGTPEIGTWSIATGEPMTIFEPVAPLAPITGPQLRPATRTFISYVILMALLAGVVIWRRERIVIPAPVQPGQVFAALSARATAAIIDLFITAPIWAPLAYWVWSGKGGLAAIAELANPSAAPSGAAVWTPAIMGAVYGLYAAAFELRMRTTPGKRLMRCTVVAEGGERCSARAVLIRNAARIVEFHFAAVVLLVVLTPSRQRLGDILARTVVTQPAPPEPEPAEQLEADHPEDSL